MKDMAPKIRNGLIVFSFLLLSITIIGIFWRAIFFMFYVVLATPFPRAVALAIAKKRVEAAISKRNNQQK